MATRLQGLQRPVASHYRIGGGDNRLQGVYRVPGAKNAILPMMAATLLTEETCHLTNVPAIGDVEAMMELLGMLGADVERDRTGRRLTITAANIDSFEPDPGLVAGMRASFLVTGPLLARFGRVVVAPPGGCEIGVRPVNVDIDGFVRMGARVDRFEGGYDVTAGTLRGDRIYLDYPSHTGTENLIMGATLADGVTVIVNASREPEVLHLCGFLRAMGADIRGAGTSVISVHGRRRLFGAGYRTMPDRMVAGTIAIATAACGGEVLLDDVVRDDLEPVLLKLEEIGVDVFYEGDSVVIASDRQLRAVEVQSMPHPGFPTDKQAEMGALLTQASGRSTISDRVFENRFGYLDGLQRLGAKIDRRESHALIAGPQQLRGAQVELERDLRAGAALTIAALVAEGQSVLSGVSFIDRGYEDLAGDLAALGADIRVARQ